VSPSLLLLLAGLALAVILFAATGGHLIFLPIFLILPLGFFGLGQRRR
jgi:hypothetical protein